MGDGAGMVVAFVFDTGLFVALRVGISTTGYYKARLRLAFYAISSAPSRVARVT